MSDATIPIEAQWIKSQQEITSLRQGVAQLQSALSQREEQLHRALSNLGDAMKYESSLREKLTASEKSRLEMREALELLFNDTADYIRINHLGQTFHNYSMKSARKALSSTPPTGYVKVEQLEPTMKLLRNLDLWLCGATGIMPRPGVIKELTRLETLKEGKA